MSLFSGLVTYRESNLLYDAEAHNFTRVWDVVHTIAREFSQQYFGNRVSPKWWTYVWLSEGLANLFQQIITDTVQEFIILTIKHFLWKKLILQDNDVTRKLNTLNSRFILNGTYFNIIWPIQSIEA